MTPTGLKTMSDKLLDLKSIALALGISRQSLEKRLKKENWPVADLQVVRGQEKKLYALRNLPKSTRDEIIRKIASQAINSSKNITLATIAPASIAKPKEVAQKISSTGAVMIAGLMRRVKPADELTDKERASRDAALLICRAVDAAKTETGCSTKRAIVELATRIINYQAHADLVNAAQTTYTKPRSSGQTLPALISRLQKMHMAYERGCKQGDAALYLVSGMRHKEPPNPIFVKAFLMHYCKPSAPPVMEAWKNSAAWFAAHGLPMPAVDTFYRLEKTLPVTLKFRGRITGSAWRSMLPYVARDVSMFKANDIWVGDGHSFKAKVQHPTHGQPFTPEVTLVIDWVSRKIVGWSVDLAESTIAVSAALRHAELQTNARPLVYYSDNGSGQTAKMLDHEVSGTLARQGIAHHTGIPGNPQGRGIIERIWQTTLIPLARTYPTCTWRGADKETTRKILVELNKKESKILLPSWNQFIDDVENCVDEYNETHTHRELSGLTPNQAYLEKLDETSVDIGISHDEIAMMWMPEEIRTPQRGVVSIFNNEYANNELLNMLAEGEKVRARFDIHNADKIWLYRMDGRYLGEAIWNGHKRAAFPVSHIEQKRLERADGKIKRAVRDIREAHAELGNTVEGEVLQVVPFPIKEREPELVSVDWTNVKKTEDEITMPYAEVAQWLYGTGDGKEKDKPKNEVAAG